MAAHGDVAWVLAGPDDPRLLRVDTLSGGITRLHPGRTGRPAYGAGSLWVTTSDTVERLDPDTGRVGRH